MLTDSLTAEANRATIFVAGTPQPTPKIQHSRKRFQTYKRDWRERKCPATGKTIRVDVGAMAAWAKLVAWHVQDRIRKDDNCRPIIRPNVVAMQYEFLIPRPKTVKLIHPVAPPDTSNLEYHIENALSGVLYEDDAQVLSHAGSRRFVVGDEKPGLSLSWREIENGKVNTRG